MPKAYLSLFLSFSFSLAFYVALKISLKMHLCTMRDLTVQFGVYVRFKFEGTDAFYKCEINVGG